MKAGRVVQSVEGRMDFGTHPALRAAETFRFLRPLLRPPHANGRGQSWNRSWHIHYPPLRPTARTATAIPRSYSSAYGAYGSPENRQIAPAGRVTAGPHGTGTTPLSQTAGYPSPSRPTWHARPGKTGMIRFHWSSRSAKRLGIQGALLYASAESIIPLSSEEGRPAARSD